MQYTWNFKEILPHFADETKHIDVTNRIAGN